MALSSCISLSNLSSQFNIDETGTHGTPEFPVAIYHNDVKDITDVLEEMYTQINSEKGE